VVNIEPHINLFAFLIILGTVQGLILSYFFLCKKNRMHQPNIFIGMLMLSFSLISLDIFLCYTGYMAEFAYLDNFTESLTFANGPLFYLYVVSSLRGKVKPKKFLHLVPFLLYTAYNLLYIVQPTGFKLTEYVHAFFPDISVETVYPRFDTDPLYLREYLPEITVLYLLIYFVMTFLFIVKAFRKEKVSLFASRYKNLSWLRNFTLSLFVLLLVLVFVKIYFGRDVGDYIITSCIALVIYGTSANVIKSSVFFTEHLGTPLTTGKKYAKSSLSEEDKAEILKKLKDGMENEKYYRNNLVSQIHVSKKLLIPAHHISQVINEKLNQTFFEFIAIYRIRDAENMLSNPEYNHLTIEDIAEEVGYNSKSAFNKTFKKITGKTPSEYRP
jgi:AraC-like DNA-binding protein